ncbi:MAG TPA: class I SAM-dependent methyltransferase [Pyrinomonadaceae bacterium]
MTCPICRSELEPEVLCRATLGYGSEFNLVECANCAVRYLHPSPTPAQLENFYSAQYYGTDWYKQQGWGKAYAESVLRPRPPGRFLDIGCGLGFFIDSIRRHTDWQVYGVEFGQAAVEFAREKLGLDVRQGALVDAGFAADYFDYIQIRNVLEHVTDPLALLAECRRILKPGGTLQLFVPNGAVDSLDLINYGRSEHRAGLSKSGHLFFFPRRTLELMCVEVGFKIVRSRTYGLRRGLASLGLWPRLKDWKRHYVSRDAAPPRADAEITLPPAKHRPDIYYTYRFHRMNLRMLPGMCEFGLDFELHLTPLK